MNRLDGKVALISGAARGIGAETARLMAEAGAKVSIGDVLDERGRETVRAIESAAGEAMYTRLDVTREEDWGAAVAAVTERFGGLDILVNNAGVFLGMSLEEATLADWNRLCGVNLTGVFLGTKLSVPALRESGFRPSRRRPQRWSGCNFGLERRARSLRASGTGSKPRALLRTPRAAGARELGRAPVPSPRQTFPAGA